MKLEKKTKLICTLGPTSESQEAIEKLALSGMTVARLNTSHGDVDEHQKRVDNIKKVRDKLGIPISILLDTKGPEIRVHTFKNDRIKVPKHKILEIFSDKEIIGDEDKFSVSYKSLPKTVKVGDLIMFDDGKLTTKVVEILKNSVKVEAQNSHKLSNKKACNIPGAILDIEFISDHDKKFIKWGLGQGIDYIAASFVNTKEDVAEIRQILKENKREDVLIMSKIESRVSVENIDDIVEASDAIMIARGDLGVEIPYYKVPEIQRLLIKKTRNSSKPVVTATQMLDSMTNNPMPTRAEVTDVTYACLLGTDSTMLSGESANGSFPILSAKVMSKISERTEFNFDFSTAFNVAEGFVKSGNAENALKAAKLANTGDTSYILAISEQGRLLKALSSFRPNAFILGITNNEGIYTKFGATYGVYMNLLENIENVYEDINKLSEIAKKWGASVGDNVVVCLPKQIKTIKVV